MPVQIRPIDPRSEAPRKLIEALDQFHFDLYPAESLHLDDVEELSKSHVHFVGAFLSERLVGIGAAKNIESRYGEIKRMFVDPEARGQGVARAILRHLESWLRAAKVPVVRLETGVYQQPAVALYESEGYAKCQPFEKYQTDPLSVFMEKRLQ